VVVEGMEPAVVPPERGVSRLAVEYERLADRHLHVDPVIGRLAALAGKRG
jgi:hypothetical protein